MSTRDAKDVRPGDFVRSFDFGVSGHGRELDGPNACYLEGQVEAIERHPEGGDCPRYKVRVTRWIFGGKELPNPPEYAYPPVNGLRHAITGDPTDYVVRIPPYREGD